MKRQQNKTSNNEKLLYISNSRALGVIALIACLLVFQIITFVLSKFTLSGKVQMQGRGDSLSIAVQNSLPARFVFNPNTISLDSLVLLGFTKRQAQSVLNFRNKGGKFYKKSDFKKLYVVDSAMYSSLVDYILIEDSGSIAANGRLESSNRAARASSATSTSSVNNASRAASASRTGSASRAGGSNGGFSSGGRFVQRKDSTKADKSNIYRDTAAKNVYGEKKSVYGKKPVKNVYMCNINTADSVALVALYGIGPFFAKRIIEYRNRLGGSFVDINQLLEIDGFNEERLSKITKNIFIDKSDIKRFNLWECDRKFLENNPYIGAYSARGIVIYLKMYEKNKDQSPSVLLENLVKEKILNKDNAERLRAYLK